MFKKNKNLKMKLQERALSYEEQMGLLPEPQGSPDILSQRYNNNNVVNKPYVKREFINLEEYNSSPQQYHNNNNSYAFKQEPTSEQMRSYLTRTLSLKRPEDVHHFYMGASYDDDTANLNNNNSNNCNNEAGTSGSEEYDDDSTISGFENVDWSSLLQDPTPTTKPSTDSSTPVLLQLKRQNSDIFSSLELWNYSHIAQHM